LSELIVFSRGAQTETDAWIDHGQGILAIHAGRDLRRSSVMLGRTRLRCRGEVGTVGHYKQYGLYKNIILNNNL